MQIPTVQGDGNNIRGFEVELIENGIQYIIDRDDCMIAIMGTKPDTSQIMNDCQLTDEGYILVDITSQMSAVKGRGDYQILLMSKSTNSQLKSFPFHIITTPAAFDIDYITSTNEFQSLTRNIIRTEEVIEEANNSISDMRDLESFIEKTEKGRADAEKSRVDAEKGRVDAEKGRVSAESTRQANEDARKINETARQNAETNRNNAEADRKNAEVTRIANENTRQNNEATRQSNENTRQTNTATTISNAEKATERANNVATVCEGIISESGIVVQKATEAANSASVAKASETNAKVSETHAASSKTAAATSATNAANSATTAEQKATEALDYAKKSQSFAIGGTGTRANEDIDNSKYYYEQSKSISEGLAGALIPMGTVVFAKLPDISTAENGWMYNISDQFTTNAYFKEGSGHIIPAGANVYKTADKKWDILAGTPVTGVKGEKETTYRQGNINLTPANIGAFPGVTRVTTAGEDLNNYLTAGIYYFDSAYTPENSPAVVNGWLIVLPRTAGGTTKQIWLRLGTLNSNDYMTYVRTSNNGIAWSDWRRFAITDEVFLKTSAEGKWLDNHSKIYNYGSSLVSTDENGFYKIASVTKTSGSYSTYGIRLRIIPDNFINYAQAPIEVWLIASFGTATSAGSVFVYGDPNSLLAPLLKNELFFKKPVTGLGTYEIYYKRTAAYGEINVEVVAEFIRVGDKTDPFVSTGIWTMYPNGVTSETLDEDGFESFPLSDKVSAVTLTVGGAYRPVYMKSGVPTPIENILQLVDGATVQNVLRLYDDGDTSNAGGNLIVQGGGNTFVGAGESPYSLYNEFNTNGPGTDETYTKLGEWLNLTSDGGMQLFVNCNTLADRIGMRLTRSGSLEPIVTGKTKLGTSTHHWASAYIDTIYGNTIGNYGTCSTAAATTTKTVECTGFVLAAGSTIKVKFTVTNTAASPTLNVNSTGAKPIYYRGAAISAGYLAANRTYEFVYNGTQYELIGDINTTYNNMTAATASAAGTAGLVPAPAAGAQTKYLRGDGTWQTPPNTTYTAASAAPKMDGSATVGTSTKYAREDHVHPTDTSRAAANHTHDYLSLAGGVMKGHINVDKHLTYIFGGETTNLLNVYTQNVESSNNGSLFLKSDFDVYLMPSNTIYCRYKNNSGYCSIHAKGLVEASSRKVKENIADITDDEALKILEVEVKTFDYIQEVGGDKNQRGCIAEDVAKIIPSAVSIPDGYNENEKYRAGDKVPGIDYSKFVPYLIKMIQIQNERIDKLDQEIEMLKNS